MSPTSLLHLGPRLRVLGGMIGLVVIALLVAACGSSVTLVTVTEATPPGALTSIGAGLQGPQEVSASVYASGLTDVSDLAYGPGGTLWATATSDPTQPGPTKGGVYLIRQGQAPQQIISQVDKPIGLAWDGMDLYVSEYGYIQEFSGWNGSTFASDKVIIKGIPAGSSGWTDNPVVGPDGRIYVENGAPCDGCQPVGYLNSDTISFLPGGKDIKIIATHIRGNSYSEFMPGTSDLFEVMNQQNALVPAPDDQLGEIKQGQDWGFPTCYGQGGAVCHGIAQAVGYLPQHNGSAGLALVNGGFGAAWGTSAFVTSFTNNAVERMTLKKVGNDYIETGLFKFITGLKFPDPIIVGAGGYSLLIGDYGNGNIYQITFHPEGSPGTSGTIPIAVPATKTGTVPAKTPAASTKPKPTSSSSTGNTVALTAAPTGALMYEQKSVTAKPGKVTIDFTNNSPLGHDVVLINSANKILGQTPIIDHKSASFTVTLTAGKYTYYCSVPGHRQAGMFGTLTVS
jgi:glucose/arabinose dehydrogenase/plastocyanin